MNNEQVLWEGKPRLLRLVLSFPSWRVFGASRSIQLTPHALILRCFVRGTLWIPLDRIAAVKIVQKGCDLWLGTGTLTLFFRGGRSLNLHAIPEPFEAWKRIKIAAFQLQRPS